MDEIRGIEEISTGIVEEYLELLKPFVQQIERLNTRIKELEDERDGFKNGQIQLQKMVSDLMDVNAKWANRVKELKKGIGKVLRWRNLDGDGISDPLREELYKLIGEKP